MILAKTILAVECALALVSPKRPNAGEIVTVFRNEPGVCMEYVTKVGRTWVDDEHLWIRPTDDSNCVDTQ